MPQDRKAVGKPFCVPLSKFRVYRDPEACPGQHADLIMPGIMGAQGDRSSSGGKEEDQLLHLPDFELDPDQADKKPKDNFFWEYQRSTGHTCRIF